MGKHSLQNKRYADSIRTITIERICAETCGRKLRTEATVPEPTELPKGGTVYLATADEEGNMVSFIQSNYMGFGSGVVVPGTGIALQNRGADFSLDPTIQTP